MLKKIATLTIVDAVTKVIGYVLLPVYLVMMPKNEFGEFGYITVAITYASLFLSLSLYVPYIKKYCEYSQDREKKELTSTIFTFIISILIILDFLALIEKDQLLPIIKIFFDIRENIVIKYVYFIVLVNTSILGLYFYSLVIAINKIYLINIYVLVKFVGVTIFSISALYFSPHGPDSVANRLAGMVVADCTLVFFCLLGLLKNGVAIKINIGILKSASKVSIPLIPLSLIGLMTALIDRRLLVEYHGLSVVANYNLALQSLAPIQMVMTSIQTIWAPDIFTKKNAKNAFYSTKKMMVILFFAMMGSSVLIALTMLLAIEINWIGRGYSEVPLLIFCLSFGVIFAQLNQLIGNMFVKEDSTKHQLFLGLILLILNYLLNVILVPIFAVYGAIVSMAISYFVILLLGIYFFEKRFKRDLIE